MEIIENDCSQVECKETIISVEHENIYMEFIHRYWDSGTHELCYSTSVKNVPTDFLQKALDFVIKSTKWAKLWHPNIGAYEYESIYEKEI